MPMLRLFLALLACAAPLAHADTYKWVDERGVVNYSNTRPPQAAQSVPDRISSYSTESPSAPSADVSRRLEADQQEWLQRQYLMAMQNAAAPAPAPDYMPAYYPAFGVVAARRIFRPAVFPSVRPAPRPAPRASLKRF